MEQKLTAEQIAELKERIKNMSPEELKEFQKKQCIFCQIKEGKVSSKNIYEDEVCFAILDIAPANPGHILLIPKEHYTIMPQVPAEEIHHLGIVVKKLSNAVLRALDAKGTNIVIANGIAAGQKAQHFMVHIIPRKEKDSINFTLPQKEQPPEELDELYKKLQPLLGSTKTEGKPQHQSALLKNLEQKKAAKSEKFDLDAISSLFRK